MTKDEFAGRVMEMQDTLYYVSYSLLHNRPDQEDAIQESLHRALRKLHTLRDDQLLRPWLTRILINECYTIMRKRTREFVVEELPCTAPQDADRGVFAAIMHLQERYRLPIILHHNEGYTTREVAMILKVPEGTIKSRLVRGRILLQEALAAEGVTV